MVKARLKAQVLQSPGAEAGAVAQEEAEAWSGSNGEMGGY